MKLRAVSNDQRVVAEKLINDVLYEAESHTLTRSWTLSRRDYNDGFSTSGNPAGSNVNTLTNLPSTSHSIGPFFQTSNTDNSEYHTCK